MKFENSKKMQTSLMSPCGYFIEIVVKPWIHFPWTMKKLKTHRVGEKLSTTALGDPLAPVPTTLMSMYPGGPSLKSYSYCWSLSFVCFEVRSLFFGIMKLSTVFLKDRFSINEIQLLRHPFESIYLPNK